MVQNKMIEIKIEPELIIEPDHHQDHHEQCNECIVDVKKNDDEKENPSIEKTNSDLSLGSDLCNAEGAKKPMLEQHWRINSILNVMSLNADEISIIRKIQNTVENPSLGQNDATKCQTASLPNRIRPLKFNCTKCNKRFTTHANLKEHLKRHDNIKLFDCPECEKKFVRKQELMRHMPQHSGLFPYTCNICKNGFSQEYHLKRHLAIHSGAREFKCKICDCSYTRMDHLRNHVTLHNQSNQFNCDKCTLSFYNETRLLRHIVSHHTITEKKPETDKSFECDICKKAFTRIDYLKRHVMRHANRLQRSSNEISETLIRK